MKTHFSASAGTTACGRDATASSTLNPSAVTCLTCKRSLPFAVACYEAEHGRIERHLDIPYYDRAAIAALGSVDPALVSLDIYSTEGDYAMPVVVYIHGGSFHFGDKREVSSKPVFFLGSGYIFVSINHRLLPDTDFLDICGDTAAALAWVYRHIGDFGGDPANIFLVGASTGGHQAALVATRGDLLRPHNLTSDIVRAVVVLDCAALDMVLRAAPELEEPAYEFQPVWSATDRVRLLNGLEEVSPVHQVSPGSRAPDFLMLVTDEDRLTHANRLRERLASTSAKTLVQVVPDRTHGTLTRRLTDLGDPYGETVLEFLRGRIRH